MEKKSNEKQSRRVFSNIYISSLCLELSLILRSGIPAAEGLGMLADDEKNSEAAAVLSDAAQRLEAGIPLYDAISATGVFPRYMLDMVRVGEETGRLDSVLEALSGYYDRRERISRTIRSAVLYPCILTALMLSVVVIMITQVLPVFNDVSRQLGVELSGTAKFFTAVGEFLSLYSLWIVLALIIAVVVVVYVAVKRFATSKRGQNIAAARFSSAMAMGMQSGLDTDASLALAQKLSDNEAMSKKIQICKTAMEAGESFSKAVARAKIFNEVYTRMLAVGFKTGSADTVMSEIARRYEELVSEETDAALGKLEPTLVIIMSVLVGLILLSVMLPLMSIMTAL